MFPDQFAAKAFFVDRVTAQAETEGVTLSRAERNQLSWTEVEGGFEIDFELLDEFDAETDAATYEAKVAGLLSRAYEHDIASDPKAHQRYVAANEALEGRDHYIMIMIDAALGKVIGPKKPWWQFW